MVTFLKTPSDPVTTPTPLQPQERVALAQAPRREDPKRARALEGGAAPLMALISKGEGTDKADGYDKFVSGRITAERFQSKLAGGFASLAAGPGDKIRLPGGKQVDAPVRTADTLATLKAAKAEHERYLQTDPYITQRIEEGYMPDVTRWR